MKTPQRRTTTILGPPLTGGSDAGAFLYGDCGKVRRPRGVGSLFRALSHPTAPRAVSKVTAALFQNTPCQIMPCERGVPADHPSFHPRGSRGDAGILRSCALDRSSFFS